MCEYIKNERFITIIIFWEERQGLNLRMMIKGTLAIILFYSLNYYFIYFHKKSVYGGVIKD